jgi:hypothetical protein
VVATTLNVFNPQLALNQQVVNGIRTQSSYFLVDGAENHDNGANSNGLVDPNVDSIAEVKLDTSSYSAEFGGRAGATINLVTRSGTRDFHGTLFEFVRNDAFDARSFFAPKVDPLRFNDFGGTIGGPVCSKRARPYAIRTLLVTPERAGADLRAGAMPPAPAANNQKFPPGRPAADTSADPRSVIEFRRDLHAAIAA